MCPLLIIGFAFHESRTEACQRQDVLAFVTCRPFAVYTYHWLFNAGHAIRRSNLQQYSAEAEQYMNIKVYESEALPSGPNTYSLFQGYCKELPVFGAY